MPSNTTSASSAKRSANAAHAPVATASLNASTWAAARSVPTMAAM